MNVVTIKSFALCEIDVEKYVNYDIIRYVSIRIKRLAGLFKILAISKRIKIHM